MQRLPTSDLTIYRMRVVVTNRTSHPACLQVRIELYLECPPLPLDTFKPLIRENMLGNTEKFQVGALQHLAARGNSGAFGACFACLRKHAGQHRKC